MKKTPSLKLDEMRKEYVLDYAKARPNRFAAKQSTTVDAVVLAPDVARVFASSASVNKALRALIRAMPPPKPAA